MLLAILVFAAVMLTYVMFQSRNSMLGFPSALFWALAGGQAYLLNVAGWDIYDIIAFACVFGMAIFCAFGAYGLREKHDTIADVEMEKGDGEYVDETKKVEAPDTDNTSRRVRDVRDRAERRRSARKPRKGEFSF